MLKESEKSNMKETFSSELKKELCAKTMDEFGISRMAKGKKEESFGAFLKGAFVCGALRKESGGFVLRSENEAFLEICEFLLISLCDSEAGLKTTSEGRINGISYGKDVPLLSGFSEKIEKVPYEETEISHPELFLRGAFLAAGTILNPEKGSHLEIVCQTERSAGFVSYLIEEGGISPKTIKRGGSFVVYLKESGKIEDFLTMIGAQSFALEIMDLGIMRDVRNNVNRQNNSDGANLLRNIDYTGRVLDAINSLKTSGRLELLPEKLQSAAKLRETYPDDTLAELSARTGGAVTKSSLARRFARMIREASK